MVPLTAKNAGRAQRREMVRAPNVVMADKRDVHPSRGRDPEIIGRRLAPAVHRLIAKAHAIGEEWADGGLCVVGTSVADDQQLEILKGLPQHGLNGGHDVTTTVVGGHHDGKERRVTQRRKGCRDGRE